MNKETFRQKMKSYALHPGSLLMMLLVMLSAVIPLQFCFFGCIYIGTRYSVPEAVFVFFYLYF